MSKERLTCLTPTHNRPGFLRRLLKFYEKHPPNFSVCILDSSEPSKASENLAIVDEARRKLRIEYRHSNENLASKCLSGLRQTHTPYVVLCADDDLLFPHGVEQSAEFLYENKMFVSAMGRTAQLDTSNARWRLSNIRILRGYTIEDAMPLRRCQRLVSKLFSTFYAVYRTEALLENFRLTAETVDFQSAMFVPEMLLSQLSVLRGPIKVLPTMYSIRQRHVKNAGHVTLNLVQPKAPEIYQRFFDCLTNQFVLANVERNEAERFVEHRYGYLKNPEMINRRFQRARESFVGEIQRTIAGITGRMWDQIDTREAQFCRSLRASDKAECGQVWKDALQVMQDFPDGMPATASFASQRSA